MKFYILAFLLLLVFSSFLLLYGHPDSKTEKAGTARIVFKSTDNGQTWQDITKGLPEDLREDSIRGNKFFANNQGLFFRFGNGLYHSTENANAPFWTKEIFSDTHSSITTGRSGIVAYNRWAVNLKKANGTTVWSSVFDSTSEPRIRSVFETAGGTIFVGTDKGFFKTVNSGKTWKHVYDGGWAGNMAESNGILLSTSKRRIIRSTDNGENWEPVNSVDSVIFDVKQIKGGFVAITSNSEVNTVKTSRLSASYDGGKTFQPIDASDKVVIDSISRTWDDRPRTRAFQTSITQVGENFFGANADGIFRSSDEGKTWKLLLPTVKGKSFMLFVSGNVIYAISSKGGC